MQELTLSFSSDSPLCIIVRLGYFSEMDEAIKVKSNRRACYIAPFMSNFIHMLLTIVGNYFKWNFKVNYPAHCKQDKKTASLSRFPGT